MSQPSELTRHYSFGGLRDRIRAGLDQLDPASLAAALPAVDEFHVGGRQATVHLADQLALAGDERLIDLGSGLGGPARFFAAEFGAQVTGIDLTPEYVEVATWLSSLTGQAAATSFAVGSVLELAPEHVDFDVATMIHVGMNLADKNTLAAAAAGALRPGGRFGIYDIMATADHVEHDLPVPWASDVATSHVAPAAEYAAALENAGFRIDLVEDRSKEAITFFDRLQSAPSTDAPPPLGLHLVLGPETPRRIGNMVTAIRAGVISPTIMIATRQHG